VAPFAHGASGSVVPDSVPPINTNLVGFLGGIGIEWHRADLSLFLSGDYKDYANSYSQITARGGLRVSF